jgi:hypothetical protein
MKLQVSNLNFWDWIQVSFAGVMLIVLLVALVYLIGR